MSATQKGRNMSNSLWQVNLLFSITSFINKVSTSGKSSAAVSEPSTQSTSAVQSTSTTSSSLPSVSVSVNSFCTKTDVLTSEVLWTMDTVNSHQSFKSCDEVQTFSKQCFQIVTLPRDFSAGSAKPDILLLLGLRHTFILF